MNLDTRETILQGIIERHGVEVAREQVRTWMCMGASTEGASAVLAAADESR